MPTESYSGSLSPKDGNERDDKLGELLSECVDRFCAGKEIDRDKIRREHPDLASELFRELETFRTIGAEREIGGGLKKIGDYEILREIGRGGMGIVYEAWEAPMNRRVAIKILPAEFGADGRSVARFLKEARIAGRLQHPNVVSVHTMGADKGVPYFVMEFVEGETLTALLRRYATKSREPTAEEQSRSCASIYSSIKNVEGDSSVEENERPDANGVVPEDEEGDSSDSVDLSYCLHMARAFASAATGLHHAHQNGVIHRDLKPSNLIFDKEGRLRILDFGLAHVEGQDSLTRSGDVLGTPLYMSPEQARAANTAIDHRTDLYSLGATLYEMLVFRPPFRGRNQQDTLSQIVHRDPRPLRQLNPHIPRDLETIVLKCLEKDAKNRYGTAEALAQDLRRFSRGDPIEARPQTALEKLSRRAWRKRAPVAIAVSCLLLLLTSLLLVREHYVAAYLEREKQYERHVLDAMLLLQYGQAKPPGKKELASLDSKKLASAANVYSGNIALALDVDGDDPRRDPLAEALLLLEKARELFRERPEAVYHQARALQLLGRSDEAVILLAPLLDKESRFVPAFLWHAVHFKDGARREAEKGETTPAKTDWGEDYVRAQEAIATKSWPDAVGAYTSLIARLRNSGDPYLGAYLEARLARGIAHLNSGDLDKALEDFATSLTLQPGAIEPVLLIARTYLRKGRPEVARKRLEDLYQHTEYRDEATLRIASLYHDFRQYERALEWAERSAESFRRQERRARCLLSLNRRDEALRAAERSVELGPEEPRAHSTHGRVLTALMNFDAAAFRLGRERTGDDSGPSNSLKESLRESGPVEAARRAYERALELDPGSISAHVGIAQTHLFFGEFESALQWIEKARTLDPDNASTLNCLGWVLTRRGDHEEAIKALERAIELDPDTAILYSNLCWNYQVAGNYEAAFEACEKALELDPYLDKPHTILGRILALQGKLAEALEHYRMATKVNPGHYLNHYNEGVILETMKRLDEAVVAYRRATELYAHDYRPFYNLGNVFLALKRYDDAVLLYQDALKIKPDDAWTHNNLGQALMEAGKLDPARAQFEKTIELTPDDPEPYVHLASILERRGQVADAIAMLREGRDKVPSPAPDAWSEKMRQELEAQLRKLETALARERAGNQDD